HSEKAKSEEEKTSVSFGPFQKGRKHVAPLTARRLRDQHDFAEGAAGFHYVDVGLRGSFQRDFGTDDRAQCAVFQAGVDAGVNVDKFGFGKAPEAEGENFGLAAHQVARSDGDVAAAADDD